MVARPRFIVFVAIAVVVAFCLVPIVVMAQEGITGRTGYTLRLRAGPGEGYPSLGVLTYQTPVVGQARSADSQWILVQSQAGRGWIAAWLTEIDGNLDTLPVSTEIVTVSGLSLTATTAARLRTGPGTGYSQINIIPAGSVVTAVGRDAGAAWILIDYAGGRGWSAAWLFSSGGTINALPVYTAAGASSLPPANMPAAPPPTSSVLSTPVPVAAGYTAHFAYIDGAARDIFRRGQNLGNNPHVFGKVGASDSEHVEYLRRFDDEEFDLAAHGYLLEVITHFSGSFTYDGQSMNDGMPIQAMLSPIWSDPDNCLPDEIPIECDYRRQRPSIVFLHLLTAIVPAGPGSQYEQEVRLIVNFYLERGVIPVLMTHPRSYAPQASWEEMNATVRALARQYRIPLWDFNATTETLPNYGIGLDGSHVTIPADGRTTYFYSDYMEYGMVRRNLETLEILHALLHQVMNP